MALPGFSLEEKRKKKRGFPIKKRGFPIFLLPVIVLVMVSLFVYFYTLKKEGVPLVSSLSQKQISYPEIKIDFSVFEKERIKNLEIPEEISLPEEKGRDDPFLPFETTLSSFSPEESGGEEIELEEETVPEEEIELEEETVAEEETISEQGSPEGEAPSEELSF